MTPSSTVGDLAPLSLELVERHKAALDKVGDLYELCARIDDESCAPNLHIVQPIWSQQVKALAT